MVAAAPGLHRAMMRGVGSAGGEAGVRGNGKRLQAESLTPLQAAEKALRSALWLINGPVRVKPPAGQDGSGKASPFPARRYHGLGKNPSARVTKASTRRIGRWPGALAPRLACCRRTAGPGRWPRPDRAGRRRAEAFPAFRPGGPCGRHFAAPGQGLPGRMIAFTPVITRSGRVCRLSSG